VSDSAHPDYEKNLASLRAMRGEVFGKLSIEDTEMNRDCFNLSAEIIAFDGQNVSVGRLKKLFTELRSGMEEYPS
jgi:hypothetical protein